MALQTQLSTSNLTDTYSGARWPTNSWHQEDDRRRDRPVSRSLNSESSLFDPESENSDVSATDGVQQGLSTFPVHLPPAPAKAQSEDSRVLQAHLSELERVENHNISKHKHLKEKRARKDDRIFRKRAIQDQKIQAVMEARRRRDARVLARREREDAAFQHFYEALEEEEGRTRARLRRIKRGLPVDDLLSNNHHSDTNSPVQLYSTVPPTAKRHQSDHPSNLSPYQRVQEPLLYSAPMQQTPHSAHTSSGPTPPAVPYWQSPPDSRQPRDSPAGMPPRAEYRQFEQHRSNESEYRQSPQLQTRPPPMPEQQSARYPSSSYDTRPPPPTVSTGFATVNQPPTFSNPREMETPPPKVKRQDPNRDGSNGEDEEDKDGKQTPSTTHPYQMSEAFANRHHHCERVDTLNRGIWTWHGPAGTPDRPTASKVEMYLKCDHEACGRIDWRTVHGLQCHIVKSHNQPKGTIGSLEKALERYGVPVDVIENFEAREGLGAGGTMADPKSQKARMRMRESSLKHRQSPEVFSGQHPRQDMSNGTPTHFKPTPPRSAYPQVYHVAESPSEAHERGSRVSRENTAWHSTKVEPEQVRHIPPFQQTQPPPTVDSKPFWAHVPSINGQPQSDGREVQEQRPDVAPPAEPVPSQIPNAQPNHEKPILPEPVVRESVKVSDIVSHIEKEDEHEKALVSQAAQVATPIEADQLKKGADEEVAAVVNNVEMQKPTKPATPVIGHRRTLSRRDSRPTSRAANKSVDLTEHMKPPIEKKPEVTGDAEGPAEADEDMGEDEDSDEDAHPSARTRNRDGLRDRPDDDEKARLKRSASSRFPRKAKA